MTTLSVRGLTVRRQRRLTLEDVSFSAPAGAITAILGAAASGKTTLLAAIAGLLPAERGAVFRGGADVTRFSGNKRGIAFLPPGTALPPARSAALSLRRFAPRAARATLADLLSALGPGFDSAVPDQQTHGEAALALAAARLLPAGNVLLIDEAAANLGPDAATRFLHAIRAQAATGRCIVLCTRDPSIARAADHLVLLHEGRAIQAGTPANLYAEPRDAIAARMLGPANILTGRIREQRGAQLVWANGSRFLHAADPGMPRPALGAEITLCLRPERIALLLPDDHADNTLDAEILGVSSAGPLLAIRTLTALGEIAVLAPSFSPRAYPAIGQAARIGWGAGAGWVLPDR